jgi:hypothetical protein
VRTITKEMAITHGEFLRILPGALPDTNHRIEGNRITVGAGDRRFEITLSDEGQRRIALLTLPVTHVTLDFIGYREREIEQVLSRFDRAFQRGGG